LLVIIYHYIQGLRNLDHGCPEIIADGPTRATAAMTGVLHSILPAPMLLQAISKKGSWPHIFVGDEI
jgi:hypothetical protein